MMTKFLKTFIFFVLLAHYSFVYCLPSWFRPSWFNSANKKEGINEFIINKKVDALENSIDILSKDKWTPDVKFVNVGQGVLKEKWYDDCKKIVTRNLPISCDKLNHLNEVQSKKYAIKLTECDMRSASAYFPLKCTGEDINVDNCLEELVNIKPQVWTTYSGYLIDVSLICSSISYSIQKDILLEFNYNLTMNYMVIMDKIKAYVTLMRDEEIRLPKFKVFLDNFNSNLKNFESNVFQMNETINDHIAQMNVKVNDYINKNFENLNQNTQTLIKELIKFNEKIQLESEKIVILLDKVDFVMNSTLEKITEINYYVNQLYVLLIGFLDITKNIFFTGFIVIATYFIFLMFKNLLRIIFIGFFYVTRIFLNLFYGSKKNTCKEIVIYNSSFAKARLRVEKLRLEKKIYDLIILNSSKFKQLERILYFCLGFFLMVIVGLLKLYYSR